MAEPCEAVIAFDMQMTDGDLHRLAESLTLDRPVEHDGDEVRGLWGATGRWSLRLTDRRSLSIALLHLPMARVEIRLSGLDAAERERFLARFHLVFRRGGG